MVMIAIEPLLFALSHARGTDLDGNARTSEAQVRLVVWTLQ
eukprot:SAG11_NODE_428_length_9551_cov_6.526978_4_plen_41_part_00